MENEYPGPKFLAIGPQKTATSWLYSALARHPDVELPPIKEIGYLWEKRFLPDRHYFSLFTNSHWFYRAHRKYITDSFQSHRKNLTKFQIDQKKLLWDLHFTFFPHTDSWYSRLFDRHSISGDITPKYSELLNEDIAGLHLRYPYLRVVISVRDPVEREWSLAKMNLCRKGGRDPNDVEEHEWMKHFNNPIQSSTNNYKALYDRWFYQFGEDNIFLMFFDELCADGWKVFNDLCQFLEIARLPDRFKNSILKPTNVGIKGDIPYDYEKYLFERYKDWISDFADAFPNYSYPREWLRKHEERLG